MPSFCYYLGSSSSARSAPARSTLRDPKTSLVIFVVIEITHREDSSKGLFQKRKRKQQHILVKIVMQLWLARDPLGVRIRRGDEVLGACCL